MKRERLDKLSNGACYGLPCIYYDSRGEDKSGRCPLADGTLVGSIYCAKCEFNVFTDDNEVPSFLWDTGYHFGRVVCIHGYKPIEISTTRLKIKEKLERLSNDLDHIITIVGDQDLNIGEPSWLY